MYTNFYVDGHVSIKSGKSSYIGVGKIELIEKIKELGSLRKAAAEMKMSYRQSWLNIEELNRFSDKPMVILNRGGKDGGIAQVTEFADNVILAYKSLQIAFADFLKEQTNILDI
jgi:molybdate transport system regulatory protein